MSRAAWLSSGAVIAGAVAALGCSGSNNEAPQLVVDAAVDAPAPNCDRCDPATEYCLDVKGFSACDRKIGSRYFPTDCLATPTCACVAPTLPNGMPCESSGTYGYSWACEDADGGGHLTITDGENWCPAGCYGSPPARLDRLA